MYIILVKNLSNCVSQTWKLDNPYCHNGKYVGRKKGTSLFFLFWEQTPLNFDHFEWACEGRTVMLLITQVCSIQLKVTLDL